MTEESLVGEEWGALPGSLVWGVTVQRVKKRGEGGNRSKWSAPERGWGKRQTDGPADRCTSSDPCKGGGHWEHKPGHSSFL